ncbi:hypothetical protein [Streptomyces sp. NPDC057363]|uniref:hypothetical protein n=1 Tax=Streptomyces sp. NPDC057363 TaxID=3346107 RepID=UPI00363B1143
MAEISYPFNEDNANGGAKVVSHSQWQAMAHMWGGDRVDFELTNSVYEGNQLPFNASVINGRTAVITPGKAWVGGFYYTLTADLPVTIPDNTAPLPRKDLIVIRADLAKSAVNIAVVVGTPAATPKAPMPRKQAGGLWEMPLYEVDAAANNASVTVAGRAPFSMPPRVSVPWNIEDAARLQPRGTFIYDMDANGNDSQYEAFNGRDGYVITRHFGMARTYTPSLINMANPSTRVGRWRYIAPATVWFSAYFENTTTRDLTVASGHDSYAVSLPRPALGATGQVIRGYLDNNGAGASPSLPNFVDVVGRIYRGAPSTGVFLTIPSPGYVSWSGLDALTIFPRKGSLTISGVYETDDIG